MNRAQSAIVRTCSWLVAHKAAWIIGLAVVSLAAAPRPAWGQWNGTNPVWTNSNVGIGTTTPNAPMEVSDPGSNNGIRITSGSGSAALNLYTTEVHSGLNRNWAIRNRWHGYGLLEFTVSTTEGGGLSPGYVAMAIDRNGNVGIGTANPQYKLAVNGNIGAQDIIVTNTGWSDYVFRSGYRLRPLSEVSAFIQANHHLPDIPSEAEVKEKGVSLGDMQAKLLAKVEELTLHLIQQEKENKDLRERLAQLENRVAASGGDASGPVR